MISTNLEAIIASAKEMRCLEEAIFASGMPVAALMEKAALLIYKRIQTLYPLENFPRVGILVGPGHNGGDALVIARELYLAGYQLKIYLPFSRLKDLTAQHARYARALGIDFFQEIEALADRNFLVDGLFGYGLERNLTDNIAEAVDRINLWQKPIVSIDLPSGIHTDTGAVLGTAVLATHTLCLGLWKLAFFQDSALTYLGKVERIDIGIPPQYVKATSIKKITDNRAREFLSKPRPLVTHKYQQGHLLLLCGSRRYAGSAVLTGLGARASGVGMVSIAVPSSLKPLLLNYLPEALIVDCPETETGAIASLAPLVSDLSKFTVVAAGPGLTIDALPVVKNILKAPCPLILDADALNILAQLNPLSTLNQRSHSTVLTPHGGEFKRLFPDIPLENRLEAVKNAAKASKATILFKGAKTAIANDRGQIWLIADSTPALARGGSGDVLTGLIGGLMAQYLALEETVAIAAWWHAQAGIKAACELSELGVDALTLAQYLLKVLSPKHGK